jgi:hypothetical protein
MGIDRSWRQTQRVREKLHAGAHAARSIAPRIEFGAAATKNVKPFHYRGAALVQSGQWVSVVTAGVDSPTGEMLVRRHAERLLERTGKNGTG